MFKRYNKSEVPNAPTLDPKQAVGPVSDNKSGRKKGAQPAEVSETSIKAKQRREKLMDVRMQLHRKLLETLNLTVLDKATEADLRREITVIAAEGLREMGMVLTGAETETLKKTTRSTIFWSTVPSRFLSNARVSWKFPRWCFATKNTCCG